MAGAYEKLSGCVKFAVKPGAIHNRQIVGGGSRRGRRGRWQITLGYDASWHGVNWDIFMVLSESGCAVILLEPALERLQPAF